MKRCFYPLLFLAGTLPALSRVDASEAVTVAAWLHALPEPDAQTTIHEKLLAHLLHVDQGLGNLHAYGQQQPAARDQFSSASQQATRRLNDALQFISLHDENTELAVQRGMLDKLQPQLKRAQELTSSLHQGNVLTPQLKTDLQEARGWVKMGCRVLDNRPRDADENEGRAWTAWQARSMYRFRPAFIQDPTEALEPVESYLPHPPAAVFWQLLLLDPAQRASLITRILTNEQTRVAAIQSLPVSQGDPSFFILLEKTFHLPDGETRTIQLPFQATIVRVNTDGVWNVLQILSNQTSQSGIEIRNRLLSETPLTDEVSISDCRTCLSFYAAQDSAHRGQTAVRFKANLELTFYQRVGSRLRDVSFRSVVSSRCKASVEKTKAETAQRACDEMRQMLAHATRLALPQSEPPATATAADAKSETSPPDPVADATP